MQLSKIPQVRVEAELALVLKRDIRGDTNHSLNELVDCVAYGLAAIELPSSRIASWDVTFDDFVADNTAAAIAVLGSDQIDIRNLQLDRLQMCCYLNEVLVSSGLGSNTMGSPLLALQWLASELSQNNRFLKAGDIILTGSLGPVIPARAGDSITITLDNFPSVQATIGG